jgi:hypothetical protein
MHCKTATPVRVLGEGTAQAEVMAKPFPPRAAGRNIVASLILRQAGGLLHEEHGYDSSLFCLEQETDRPGDRNAEPHSHGARFSIVEDDPAATLMGKRDGFRFADIHRQVQCRHSASVCWSGGGEPRRLEAELRDHGRGEREPGRARR